MSNICRKTFVAALNLTSFELFETFLNLTDFTEI